jgi:RNA polymerase sigma-70 factor (ECF subfamily)
MRTIGWGHRVDRSDPGIEHGDDRMGRFRSLYRSTFNDIYAYATRALSPDQSEIDDVVAEVYLVVWRRIDELPQSPQDRLWLFGVARNVVRSTKRSTNRRLLLVDRIHRQARLPVGSSESSDVDVTDALRRLSPKEREVMQLVVWDGLSAAETAEVLNCSVNVVQVRLHRARRRLARRVRAVSEDSDGPVAGVVPSTEVTTRQMDTENRQ